MKASVVALCLFSALAFASTAIAQVAGIILLQSTSIPALVGSLVAAGVLAFAFGDYSRKPSFRLRRTPGHSTHLAGDESGTSSTQLDWTYAPRTA
jgi:hypothetical protein